MNKIILVNNATFWKINRESYHSVIWSSISFLGKIVYISPLKWIDKNSFSFVLIYIHIYAHLLYLYTYVYIPYIYMCMYIYAYMYVCTYQSILVCIGIWICMTHFKFRMKTDYLKGYYTPYKLDVTIRIKWMYTN